MKIRNKIILPVLMVIIVITGCILWMIWRAYRASGGRVRPPEEIKWDIIPKHSEKMEPRFSEGLKPVKNNEGKYGYIDESGKVVISYQFMDAFNFSEGLASIVVDGGKYGYINKAGGMVIEPRFQTALPFSEGLAAVDLGYHYYIDDPVGLNAGYIDHQGNFVIGPKFQSAGSFNNGVARVTKGSGETVLINKKGEEVPWVEKE